MRNRTWLAFLGLCVGVIICSYKIEAAELNELDLLIEENSNISEVKEEIKKINPEIKLTSYDEVGLIHIDLPKDVNKDTILNNTTIEDNVELAGNMPLLVSEEDNLVEDTSNVDIDQLSEEDTSADEITDKELYDILGWHVDEVTNNKKSFEISKGEDIKVAIIDSGVDYNHPLLKDSLDLSNAKSYVPDEKNILDTNGHGTMVSGLVKQVAPEAILVPYKVIGSTSGESVWTIAAIIDAVNDGNDIINMSLGTYKCYDDESEKLLISAYKRAVRYAKYNNVLVVASSGNKGQDLDNNRTENHTMHLPGSIDGVCAVSSVTDNSLASYSNYGSCVEFCAPGGDLRFIEGYIDLDAYIYVLYPTYKETAYQQLGVPYGYAFSYGTSLSAPMVTGALADVLSYCKDTKKYFDINDAEKVLALGSIDLGEKGKDSLYGFGKINIYNALTKAVGFNENEVDKVDATTYKYSGEKIDALYQVVAQYDNYYQVQLTITNKTDKTLQNWAVAYQMQDKIEQIWNAEIEIDDEYTIIKNKEYNQDLAPHSTVTVGYIVKADDVCYTPNEFLTIDGRHMVKETDYDIKFSIDDKWDTGYTGTIAITNNSDREIKDWQLEFKLKNQIDSMWLADIIDIDDDVYVVKGIVSNRNIKPGETIEIHFNTTSIQNDAVPTEYILTSSIEK